jgi:hypothetical protein
MFVVWKLYGELQSIRRITKCQSRVVTRRHSGVTDRADWWSRTLKELRAMTADARSVSGIVSYVGVGFCFLPRWRRYFVTGVAGPLMFISSVGEL